MPDGLAVDVSADVSHQKIIAGRDRDQPGRGGHPVLFAWELAEGDEGLEDDCLVFGAEGIRNRRCQQAVIVSGWESFTSQQVGTQRLTEFMN